MGSGVDLELFTPSPQPLGVPIVMLPSRLLWNKGVAEFVAAAELLTSTGVKARFVLVGDTDEGSPSAIPRSKSPSGTTQAELNGGEGTGDMQNVLRQASIVCLPSYREGVPKFLIEAAACGRPIVTTDVPGCRDVVQHYVNGMLVPPKNTDVLALTIRVLLGNSDLRKRMGEAGRKIAAHFSQDVVTEKTLVRYGLLTNSRGTHQ